MVDEIAEGPATSLVLLIEDEESLVSSLSYYLRKNGFNVVSAMTGAAGILAVRAERPDVIVLDLMLPGIDGLEVCRRMRERWPIPVVMLTALGDETDRLIGFETGADDYVTKPFEIAELAARLRALMRRTERESSTDDKLAYADVVVDTRRHHVTRDGQPIALTPTEYRLLEYFMRNPETVLAREAVLLNVWGYEGGESNYLDVHVGHLREKLEAGGRPRLIQTVRAFGYQLQMN